MNKLFLFAVCLIFGQVWGFAPGHITSNFPYRSEWASDTPDSLEAVLSQPYSYLAAGSQSYAFVSEDGRYVIKFFRMKHFSPHFKDLFRPARAEKKRRNASEVFGSYKLAYDEMRDDAGLIYVHLNRTDFLKRELKLVDKAGQIHAVDLDTTVFVLQRKAELLGVYLGKQTPEGREEATLQLLRLIERRSRLRMSDKDPGISQNFGFADGKVMQIDVGRLYRSEVVDREAERERVLSRMREVIASL